MMASPAKAALTFGFCIAARATAESAISLKVIFPPLAAMYSLRKAIIGAASISIVR